MIKSKPLFYFLILVSSLLVSQPLFARAGLNDCGFDYSSAYSNYGGSFNSNIYLGAGSTFAATYAALKADGSITVFGSGAPSGAPTDSGYVSIASTKTRFEAVYASLKADGSITTWGDAGNGGSGAPTDAGYVSIVSTRGAFAAIKVDGSIAVWGNPDHGGSGAPTDSGYVNIASTEDAFAAIKADGSIAVWGNPDNGGSGAPTDLGYVHIFANSSAFAAIKGDGSINTWGNNDSGGNGAPADAGYISITSAQNSFAALKADGSITNWGLSVDGPSAPTDSGYVGIVSNETAYAALKANGNITAWGFFPFGGDGAPTDSGYVSIVASEHAFAALKADGSISAWGGPSIPGASRAPTDSGYISIVASTLAFAALKADGSITAWGSINTVEGGDIARITPTDSGYVSIASTNQNFAALKADGNITAWGFNTRRSPTDTDYVSINGVGPGTPSDCVFRLDLNPANQPPVGDEQTVLTAENTAVDITLTGSDPEDDPISFALIDEPVNGGLSGAIPLLSYTPNVGFTGADGFTFIANDGTSDSEPATISITISEAPDATAPVITLNGPALINLGVGDSYTEAGATAEDDRDGEVGVEISGAVDTATAGDYTITYTAIDAAGNIAMAERTVTVSEDTTPPPSGSHTVNPTDDANSRVELNGSLAVSRWEHAFFRFDVSQVSGAVSSATFRVYFTGAREPLNLFVGGVENDDWAEGSGTPRPDSSLHSNAANQLDSISATEAGYIEFNVSDFVAAQVAGDGVVTLEVASDNASWNYLLPGGSDTPPELLIEVSGPQPNQEPVAVASAAAGSDPLTVSFNGGDSSDSDGGIAGYAWDFGDGSTGTGETVSHSYSEAGDYSVTLIVTDNEGATAGTTININTSDPGGPDETSHSINPTDDANSRVDLGSSLVVSRWEHAFFRFDVSQVNGAVSSATFRVYFTGAREPLNLFVGGIENDGWAEGSGTPDPNSSLHSDPASQLDSISASEAGYIDFNVSDFVAAQVAGDGVVTLEIASDNGSWNYLLPGDSDTPPELLIEVSGPQSNQAPVAVASAAPEQGDTPLSVTFNGGDSSDSDGSIASYAWDFGDGDTATGETVGHDYAGIGEYAVTLTVTDNEGATDSTTVNVSVTDPDVPDETSQTVNPSDDANSRVDLGSSLAVSRWEHAFFRFDVSQISAAVSSATFRVYYLGARAPLNLYIGGVENDDWAQGSGTPDSGSSLHSDPASQLDSITATEAGYIEFNVSDFVAAQVAGDGIVTLEIASDDGGWDRLLSSESDTPPALVIETQTDGVTASSISGRVNNAVDSSPLAGVTVVLSNSGGVVAETTTDASGSYTFAELPATSGYNIAFSIEGYLPLSYRSIETTADSTTFLETVLQIDERFAGVGTASGQLTDAVNGAGLATVDLSFRQGINTTTGEIVGSAVTDASGGYEITTLEAGSYTAEATLEGYQTGHFTVVVVGGASRDQQNATLTPLVTVDNVRIVLTWDESPRDLDSHLTGPANTGRFHVFYQNRSTQYANLDVDDTSSFGPETITITQQSEGVYRYSVHDFSNRGSATSERLSLSGARVQVFGDTGLLAEFNVPNQAGTLWTVFELTGNQITPVNSMTNESSPGSVRSINAVKTDASLMRNLPEK